MSKPRVFLLTFPSLFGAGTIAAFAQENRIELVGIGLSGRLSSNRCGLELPAGIFAAFQRACRNEHSSGHGTLPRYRLGTKPATRLYRVVLL